MIWPYIPDNCCDLGPMRAESFRGVDASIGPTKLDPCGVACKTASHVQRRRGRIESQTRCRPFVNTGQQASVSGYLEGQPIARMHQHVRVPHSILSLIYPPQGKPANDSLARKCFNGEAAKRSVATQLPSRQPFVMSRYPDSRFGFSFFPRQC